MVCLLAEIDTWTAAAQPMWKRRSWPEDLAGSRALHEAAMVGHGTPPNLHWRSHQIPQGALGGSKRKAALGFVA